MKHYLPGLIFILIIVSAKAQDCSELFISEYVEGSAQSKALEIYNPTNDPVDLSLYVVKRYSNGSPFPTEELALSGTLQPKDVVVVTNGQTDSVWVENGGYWSPPIAEELYEIGDLHCSGEYPTPMYYNGDDAMTLETITGGVVDIFGKIGQQPENGWNDIPPSYTAGAQWWTSWTENQTLIRKPNVKYGVTDNPALFMVHLEWDSIPNNVFDSLGFHKCDCNTLGIGENFEKSPSAVIYPNPIEGKELNINATKPWIRVEIETINGSRAGIYSQAPASKTGNITIADLTPGIYIMRIFFEDEKFLVERFIRY